MLSIPLAIGRSNITVRGTVTTSLADTTLLRSPESTRALLAAYDQSPNLTSITVRDFTFDGGGGQAHIETDVRFDAVKSLLVTNCAFVNSPFAALELGGSTANGYTSGAVLNNISVDNVDHYGLLALTSGDEPDGYLTCDSMQYLSNIVLANSTFRNTGDGALNIQAKNVRVTNNTLQHNQDIIHFDAPGGQIYIEVCADNLAITNNVVSDGPLTTLYGVNSEGIELHGTNLDVVDNTITNNAGPGIQMSGVQNVFIANWTPGTGVVSNNLAGSNLFGGISLYNATPGDVNERQVDFITIDHAVSINDQLAGIGIFLETGQTNPIKHVTITNNCLSGNRNGPLRVPGIASDAVINNNLSSACPQ